MREVVIIDGMRTPTGRLGGSLKDISAVKLGEIVVKHLLEKNKIEAKAVNQVIFGNVLQAGLGQNPARQIALNAGLPFETTAMTINEVCGSGLKSVMLARQGIQLGEADVIIAGGVENMSQAPFLLKNHRFGHKFGPDSLVDSMSYDGLTDVFSQQAMGVTAEAVAEKFDISREAQDEFAYQSQMKAAKAQAAGDFDREIVPVTLKNGEVMTADETIRGNITVEKLSSLHPAFKENGTVTAGNSSSINDGGAAIILMAKEVAEAKNIPYMATIKATAEVGIDPAIMGYAPYHAVKKLVEKAQIDLADIDLFQLNEAFASQSVAVVRDLGIDPVKVNIFGGAIALGHPIGASGSKILATLLTELEKNNQKTGVVSLCVGGGLGVAMLIERA